MMSGRWISKDEAHIVPFQKRLNEERVKERRTVIKGKGNRKTNIKKKQKNERSGKKEKNMIG